MTNEEIIKFLQSKQIPQCGDKEYTADEEYEAYQRAIDALEQTTWIPVSERLPEKNVKVLATTEWGAVTIAEIFGGDWFVYEGASNANADDILAWMPLPEPYKGE